MRETYESERSGLVPPRGLRAPRRTPRRARLTYVTSQRVLVDSVLWCAAGTVGVLLMGGSALHGIGAGAIAAGLQIAIGLLSGLYRGRWRISSFDEAVALSGVVVVVANLSVVVAWTFFRAQIPIAATIVAPFMALSAMLFVRGLKRCLRERRPTLDLTAQTPVLIFGAGDAGGQLVRSILGNVDSGYRPVALFDDDPSKRNLRIQGIAVRGTRDDIAAVAAKTGSGVLIAAVPSAGSLTISELERIAITAGLEFRVLPPTQELIAGIVTESDVREVTEADLLGRRTIDTDLESIASYLTGARVLVTGAGGSIGSELCRQISRFSPGELVMVDRDESALHRVQMSLEGRALLDSRNLVIADIRDADRVTEVFAEHQPEVVFHAAALKHLSFLEMYPLEGWKTNVVGTNNVLRTAATVGVQHFVNVSTDKAADPSSVLGYTKRLAEQLTSWYANRSRGDWVSVRFGNVLGSRGSVLEAFRSQMALGGPLTVTHPDVTRYFMTAEEACELVIAAGAVGHRGEALVLDMGEPVRILDVAQRLADSSDRPIQIEFTGLRPGEKLHEALISTGELDVRRTHPLISHVAVPALRPTQLGLLDESTSQSVRASMRDLCMSKASTEAITI